jgi:CheY-like chemotaxis protein
MTPSHPPVQERKPTILLAEDQDDVRRVYGMLLRHFGYAVEEATTGPDAVDRAHKAMPDLILMDIGLPLFDGWEAARLLKADAQTSGIPLLAFSARVDSIADLHTEPISFDGFIAKPVSPMELVRRVGAYLTLIGKPVPAAMASSRRAASA